MVFKLSPESKYIEMLMELKSYCRNVVGDLKKVVDDLEANRDLDHANDTLTREAIDQLLLAQSAANMKDIKDTQKHIHATLQKLHAQQKMDLEDDKPRIDARIKLAEFTERALNQETKITDLLKEIKELKKES